MSEDIRRKYIPEQTERMREEMVARIARGVGQVFEKHPALRSALMLVSQYWNDEAQDAVHCYILFSKLATPDLKAAARGWEEDTMDDSANLPEGMDDFGTHKELAWTFTLDIWKENGDAIPLFAAFTKEGCNQSMPPTESGAPYAVFRCSPTGVETELVREMWRPWLDGVMPESDQGDAG